MRVAIIGGTGFVGSYLVDELIEQGHEVSLLVREGSEHKVRSSDSIRVVPGSINSSTSICDALAGCDAVIYCVGILREFPRQGITFESTQFDGVASERREDSGNALPGKQETSRRSRHRQRPQDHNFQAFSDFRRSARANGVRNTTLSGYG